MRRSPSGPATLTAASVLLLTCSLPARGEELATALARPVSPGAVALLVEHTKEPAVVERLAEALKDPRPEVRAAAARVINVAGLKAVVPDLRSALAVETDRRAGVEQAWGLAALGTTVVDEEILAAAERLGPAIVGTAALILARTRGPEMIRRLPLLADETRAQMNWFAFVRLASRGEAAGLGAVTSAVFAKGDAASLRAILEAARELDVPVDSGLLVAALRGDQTERRALVYCHLAALRAVGKDLPEDVLTVVKPGLDDRATPPDPAEALSRELLRRALGYKAVDKGPWISALAEGTLDPPGAYDHEGYGASVLFYTKEELKAAGIHEGAGRWVKRKRDSRKDAARKAALSTVRTVGEFPEGLVSDILQITNCQPAPGLASGGASISYGHDGRPRRITVMESAALGGECMAAARALLVTSLAPVEWMTRPEPREVVILPLRSEFTACLVEGNPPPAAKPPRVTAPVKPGNRQADLPRKIRDVMAVYPPAARQERLEGVVVLEAEVSATGCIGSLRLLKGVTPSLDWAAVQAVSAWQYAPVLQDGRAIRFIITVPVNFRLK